MRAFKNLIEFVTRHNKHFYNRDIKCPVCGESVYVDLKNDFYQIMDNGNKEYFVRCPECGQAFYTAESYD